MCVYSAVIDHFDQRGWPNLDQPLPPPPGTVFSFDPEEMIVDGKTIREWKKQIAEFKEAAEAAKVVDRLTDQPDCEDPTKLLLVERVALLEKRLNAIAKAVGV
jgi:hypothetical protein